MHYRIFCETDGTVWDLEREFKNESKDFVPIPEKLVFSTNKIEMSTSGDDFEETTDFNYVHWNWYRTGDIL